MAIYERILACKSQDSVGRFCLPLRANMMPEDPQNLGIYGFVQAN
jgi:hypothetical protein